MTYSYPDYFFAASHGGACCGVYHVFSFPMAPTDVLEELGQVSPDYGRAQAPYRYLLSPQKAPQETAKNRLCRVLTQLWNIRLEGIIEVVLTHHQAKNWQKTLEAIGFVAHTPIRNSNSGNYCIVFLLDTMEFKDISDKPEAKTSTMPESRAANAPFAWR